MTRLELAQKYAKGIGIEIGSSHKPWPNPHNASVDYIEKRSLDILIKEAPEEARKNIPNNIFIEDGTLCASRADSHYDFIASSHVFEHLRNPILALQNWVRILKPGGHLIFAIPEKTQTFDKDRSLTPFEHMVKDYIYPGNDDSHYDETHPGNNEIKKIRPEIHFHVWTKETLKEHFILFCKIFDLQMLEFEFVSFEVLLVLKKGGK
jgi:SAM-dependent methyltransferase